jgi:toxin-antitoxin system PIN domain toxin
VVLLDVNVLVYAHREDAPGHSGFRKWLEATAASPSAFGLSDGVLAGFLRIVTHPRVFDPPSPMKAALAFADELRGRPSCVLLAPGPRHWEIFTSLCRRAGVKGNLVPDAYLAALAIETGSELITTDRDFSRFPGLRWRHPLA